MKILLAVDGSAFALKAVDWVIAQLPLLREPPQIELVTVYTPLPEPPILRMVVAPVLRDELYREEGEISLAPAQHRLAAAGVEYRAEVLIGAVAASLNLHAEKTGCCMIVVGTHGRGSAAQVLLGSVATAVTHLSKVPVLLVR